MREIIWIALGRLVIATCNRFLLIWKLPLDFIKLLCFILERSMKVLQIIEQGETTELTRNNPLLQNARETIYKLDRQLDEMNLIIKKTRDEGRILSEYKDLIDKSRKQFASELKSVLPNVDIHAQG